MASLPPHRWIKFEEKVEKGGERWSKPHVATLSLHSLFELRSCILNGTVMLDMRANSIDDIAGLCVCVCVCDRERERNNLYFSYLTRVYVLSLFWGRRFSHELSI